MSTRGGALRRLGAHSVATFLSRYWQRQPLYVRQAMAGLVNPAPRERLFALAGDDQVESRLVSAHGDRWRVQHGPFAPRQLPSLRRPAWTLLVQGVDLHDAAVAALAARFAFLPAARFDDVMISYASDQGGVGPHVDQYDVFLLQAHGRRRWRIARRFDPHLRQGLPLRILDNFHAEHEWVLEPGDLLYLPPGVAHEGVALGECITISIGFRLPAWEELADSWADYRARTDPRAGHVPDHTRTPTATPARLPAKLVVATQRELARAVPTRTQARCTLLEHLTEPKPSVQFEPLRRAPGPAAFARAARRDGLHLDLRSRMLYEGGAVAINGELCAPLPSPGRARALVALRTLANGRRLTPGQLQAMPAPTADALLPILHSWYRFGWIGLGTAPGN